MRLFIDPSNASKSALGAFFRAPQMDQKKVWLDISIKTQERSRWCWAAIAQALVAYYYQKEYTQEQLVAELLERPIEQTAAHFDYNKDDANQNFKLDAALKHVDCFGHWSPGKPLFERIQFEINQGHPISARIEWPHGEAHYVLIHGYLSHNQQVLVSDPIHGPSCLDYRDFPRKYQGNRGTWTETFWTNKSK